MPVQIVSQQDDDGAFVILLKKPGIGMGHAMSAYLLDGSSREMAIDADPTPVVFTWNPDSNDVYGLALVVAMEDAAIDMGDAYGGIDSLDNGVLIEIKAEDVEYEIANIKTTREFNQLAEPGSFELIITTPDNMNVHISLDGYTFKADGTYSTPDYVRVTIRDDLNNLVHQSALFKGVEVD